MGQRGGAVRINQGLAAEVELMLADGTIEGLVRRLRRSFPALSQEAEAAVSHGVEKLIVREIAPANPRSYLAACAVNEMKRLGRHRARHVSLEALAEVDGEDGPGWEPPHDGWTVEEQALLTATFDELRAHVTTWDTENVKVVTLLCLEAAVSGEPLPSLEAAELATDILGYHVDDAFVRTWKSRGYKRLRAFVKTVDAVDA